MPTSCCAIGCSNHSYKKACIDRKVSFHKFPHDPLLKKAWLFEMRRQDFKPSWTTKICSDHFEQDCFTYQKTTNRRCLVKDALPTIFSFLKKDNKKKSSNSTGNGSTSETTSVPKGANGKMQFVGYLPGREPRGQAKRPTFKDFIMSKEASKAQSKLTETNEKLAVLHKRRIALRGNAKYKPFDLSESSPTLLYPPYESHFVNYKGKSLSRSSQKPSLESNLTYKEPVNDSSERVDDPPVEDNSSDDESSNHSEYLSSEESFRESPLNSDESSSGSLYQPPEENLTSDESSVDSPSYKNVYVKKKESKTTSALQESNLSSDENSTNLVSFISKLSCPISSVSSPKETENVTVSADLQKLLIPLEDNNSGDKKSLKSSSKKSAAPSSDKKLFKFKHRIQPKILKEKNSSIAKHLERNDPAHKYYFERLASDKNVESSDALFSNSFRWEIAAFKGKLNERLARARREKMKLRKKLKNLRRNTEYWRRKNANIKSLLHQQDVEQDA